MTTIADTNTWKQLLSSLQQTSKENQSLLQEIRQELEKQKEKVRTEISAMADGLRTQQTDLQDLLDSIEQDPLLNLAKDETITHLETALKEQLSKTTELLDQTEKLLEGNGDAPAMIEPGKMASRSSKDRSSSFLPKLFRQEHVLGNWVHYFNNNTFTCQSFWEDGSFKEYDFENNKLAGEREGTYEIIDGSILLDYGSSKKDEYQITGFSDERIDYLIHGNHIQFDYMPESLLNQFLED